jgi:hypothetical protein
MDGTVVRPCGCDDGVDVLLEEGWAEASTEDGKERGALTFDFGGAAFGLQAFLTTFSNEDICNSQR